MSLTKKMYEAIGRYNCVVLMYIPIVIAAAMPVEVKADKSFPLQLTLIEKSAAKGCIVSQQGQQNLIYSKSAALWSNKPVSIYCRSLSTKTSVRSLLTPLTTVEHMIPVGQNVFVIGKSDSLYVMSLSPQCTIQSLTNLSSLGFSTEATKVYTHSGFVIVRQENIVIVMDTKGSIIDKCSELLWLGKCHGMYAAIQRNGNRTEFIQKKGAIRWRLPNFQFYHAKELVSGDIQFLMTNIGSTFIHSVTFSPLGSMKSMRQIECNSVISPIKQQFDGSPVWMTQDQSLLSLAKFDYVHEELSERKYRNDYELVDNIELYGFDHNKTILTLNHRIRILQNDDEGTFPISAHGMTDISWNNNIIVVTDKDNMYVLDVRTNPYWLYYEIVNNHSEKVVILFTAVLLMFFLVSATKNKKIMSILMDKNSTVGIIILQKNGIVKEVNIKAQELLGTHCKGRYFIEIMEDVSEEFTKVSEQILKERRGGTGVYPMHIGSDIREYSIEWIPVMTWIGSMQVMVIRITDLTNVLERRRLMDWAHLAHDMQTNLSVIRLSAEALPADDEDYARQKMKILHQANILLRRVRDIMTIARNKTTEFQKISSEEICRRVLEELDTSSLYSITVKKDIQSVLFDADPERIIRALMNAAHNGIKAMAGTEGILTLTTYPDNDMVCFTVSDTGVGMDEETKKNMFVPFFTTSRRGGGSGIGSMVIQKIINDHKGKIIVQSEIGEGTTIIFKLPKKQL